MATTFVEDAVSSTVEMSATEIVGAGSLSVINIDAVAVPNVALSGLLSVTEKISSSSSTTSPKMGMERGRVVWPGEKVKVPFVDV